MVKRIKHIHDLKTRQQLLLQKQQITEAAIKNGWNELKESLYPGNIIQDLFLGFTGKKKKNGTHADGLLSAGLTYITKKIISKVDGWFS